MEKCDKLGAVKRYAGEGEEKGGGPFYDTEGRNTISAREGPLKDRSQPVESLERKGWGD